MNGRDVNVVLEIDLTGYFAGLARATDTRPRRGRPRPLAIDGRAYRRRTRSRTRRNHHR